MLNICFIKSGEQEVDALAKEVKMMATQKMRYGDLSKAPRRLTHEERQVVEIATDASDTLEDLLSTVADGADRVGREARHIGRDVQRHVDRAQRPNLRDRMRNLFRK